MRKPNNWDSVKPVSSGYTKRTLPAGGYEARIINAAVLTNSNGTESLAIQVDITNGEFANFFKQDYDSNPFDNRKWRGTARFFCPIDNGSENDERTKGFFKAMTEAVEKSNPGYKWNWDEKTLKGLKVGILVRDKEYDYMGSHGFSSDIFAFVDIQIIKNGEFETPKPKYLSNNVSSIPAEVPPQLRDEDAPPAPDDYPF